MIGTDVVGLGRRILIVEDDARLASRISHVLITKGFEVATAGNAAEGYEVALEFDPDQALLDVMLGEGPTGVDLAYSLAARMPWVALVLVTNVLDLAAAGLPPPPPGTGLVNKGRVADLDVLVTVMEASLTSHEPPFLTSDSPFRGLTRTQVAVMRLMAQGWTNEAITRQRGCSKSAVENRVNEIYRVLAITDHADINRRAEAVRIFVNAVGPVQRSGGEDLTPRFRTVTCSQMEVLNLVAQGYSNEAIATRRATSTSAVEQLLHGIYRALAIDADPDLAMRAEAVRLYINTFGPVLRADS